ncbi:MAG: rod shape-determining protein MreC [Paracoccaceae bacterium]|nr:rod shape-determining protein MreC [Paracoccaceae bacterium]
MARNRNSDNEFGGMVKRILTGILVVLLIGLFLLWRIDNPRVERFRMALIDRIVPSFDWALVPITQMSRMVSDFQSYAKLYERNIELQREIQRLKSWREAALQLEQTNAKLLALNKVRISPKLTYVTGVVLTDSGSPFRKSALINVGRRDGVRDGWVTMDGLGLVGRISGVGETVSRVILLTDSSSRIPVTIMPSGQKAIMAGTNGPYPVLEFVKSPKLVHPGDRVLSTGDGKLFPPRLLVGQVVMGRNGQLMVQLAADYQRLEFLRVLRTSPAEQIGVSDELVGGAAKPAAPAQPAAPADGGNDG